MASRNRIVLLIFISTIFSTGLFNVNLNVVQAQVSEPLPLHNATVDDNQCGGVLEVQDESGTLSYKYQRRYNQYESCIWTVHAPNKPLIKINITRTYFNGASDYVAVGFFNKSNYDQLNFFTWIKLDSFSEPSIEVPGPVAFIHFVSTNSYPGLGFRLTYEGSGDFQKSIYKHDNYFLQGEFGAFQYPPEGGSYGNNQRTTIVLKANKGSSRINGQPYSSWLNIKKVNLEESQDCVVDNLNIFSFGEGADAWYKNNTYCGKSLPNHAWGFLYPRNDPIILTFKSDDSGAGEGFEFFWETFN